MPPKERRRARRAEVITRVRGVYLTCPELGPLEFKVLNISEVGLGLATNEVTPPPEIGNEYTGIVKVGYTAKKVRMKVARKTDTLIGIEFIDPDPMLKGAIRTFFQPELLGAALRPLRASTALHPRMVDDDGNSLEAVFKAGDEGDEPQSLEILILGNRFTWKKGGLLRWIQNDQIVPLDEFMRKQLMRYVANVNAMSPSRRALLETVLRVSPSEGGDGRSEPAPDLEGSS